MITDRKVFKRQILLPQLPETNIMATTLDTPYDEFTEDCKWINERIDWLENHCIGFAEYLTNEDRLELEEQSEFTEYMAERIGDLRCFVASLIRNAEEKPLPSPAAAVARPSHSRRKPAVHRAPTRRSSRRRRARAS